MQTPQAEAEGPLHVSHSIWTALSPEALVTFQTLLRSEYLRPHKYTFWNPYSQCNGVRRWSLWDYVMKVKLSEWDYSSYKKDFTELSQPFCHVRTSEKTQAMNLEEGPRQRMQPRGCLDLELPASRTLRNKILLFISYLVCGTCYSPEGTETDMIPFGLTTGC